MNAEGALTLARRGELYPGVILHGAADEERRRVAHELTRTLLCTADPEERPCGVCPHCRRIAPFPPPEEGERPADAAFHPDVQVLERDLKTSTSVDATKAFLRAAHVSPFEARGQVFVIGNAETLTGEAANALLKTLEEPHVSAPRHFLLLAPSQLDLLPTLRSRSLAIYLGAAEALPGDEVGELATELAHCIRSWSRSGSAAWLLAAAEAVEAVGEWKDPRAGRPWSLASRALVEARERLAAPANGEDAVDPELGRAVLALAEDLLRAPPLRLRAVRPGRILDGLFARHLAPHAPPDAAPAPGGPAAGAGGRCRRRGRGTA